MKANETICSEDQTRILAFDLAMSDDSGPDTDPTVSYWWIDWFDQVR